MMSQNANWSRTNRKTALLPDWLLGTDSHYDLITNLLISGLLFLLNKRNKFSLLKKQ